MSKTLRIRVLFRGKQLKSKTMQGERFVIGRDPECDLSLFNVGVSRQHALIERNEAGYVLRDLGSSNGTYVAERAIQSWPIEDGGTARITKFELIFDLTDSAADRSSPTADGVFGFGGERTMSLAD